MAFGLVTERRVDPAKDPVPAQLAVLFSYWLRKREGNPMPSRRAFDPSELRSNAGRMHLLVVEAPGVFRYRVYGSRVTNPDAADMTGRTTLEYRDRAFGELVTRHLRECVEKREPVCCDIRARLDDMPYEYIRMALPLCESGSEVTHVLVGTVRGTVPKKSHARHGGPNQVIGRRALLLPKSAADLPGWRPRDEAGVSLAARRRRRRVRSTIDLVSKSDRI